MLVKFMKEQTKMSENRLWNVKCDNITFHLRKRQKNKKKLKKFSVLEGSPAWEHIG